MKISKLFHWLYAFLMFLPITFILPTLLYFGFNDNATAQEYTKEEPIYYESNEVNSSSDLIEGHIYEFNATNVNFSNPVYVYITEYVLKGSYVIQSATAYLDLPYISCQVNVIDIRDDIGGVTKCYQYTNNANFYFVFKGFYSQPRDFADYVSETDYKLVKEYHEVTYTMGITDSVNQAIIDTFDLPMFSWATNNILVAPFSSICSFFGIASTSVLIKYLYYWLTISVIWLVFDVLMYIPLLVHNYIDKARIE